MSKFPKRYLSVPRGQQKAEGCSIDRRTFNASPGPGDFPVSCFEILSTHFGKGFYRGGAYCFTQIRTGGGDPHMECRGDEKRALPYVRYIDIPLSIVFAERKSFKICCGYVFRDAILIFSTLSLATKIKLVVELGARCGIGGRYSLPRCSCCWCSGRSLLGPTT
ncbi:hypothetical protein TNCT_129171 [Trichonephila clavata]|uniref:Uncharacterized protein n=1 Tax=Trichonephila clavata TaxID=2740835 RepID=A0A8X6INT7_TRICU|nr:hypothetical protein TNCT_129171 [Trichonephila clavata]